MDYRVAESLSPRGKQRCQRQRLKARGLVHVQGWVTPAQAEAIRQIMAGRGGAGRRTKGRRASRENLEPVSVRTRPDRAG